MTLPYRLYYSVDPIIHINDFIIHKNVIIVHKNVFIIHTSASNVHVFKKGMSQFYSIKNADMKTLINKLAIYASYAFILLFTYAAGSKMLDFENFQVQLAQSPLLSAYAGFISYAVIIIEVMIAGVLADPKVRRIGLYASFGLMVAFTVYIFLILKYSDFVPCSCGGILEKMGWTEHLIFNAVCVVLALITSVFMGKERAHGWSRIAAAALIAVFSAGSMVALFLSSEYIMKKENNFTRRFPHHPILEEQSFDLGVNSFYFAGNHKGDLYLGNPSNPFRIFKLDSLMQKMDTINLNPGSNFRFKNLRYCIVQGNLYSFDGTVPVIYSQSLDSLSMPLVVRSSNQVYFDQLVAVSPSQYLLRVEDYASKRLGIASLSLLEKPQVAINQTLLSNKADGGFEGDGKLLYDTALGDIYYMFYYKNTILKLNASAKIVRKMKTIDPYDKPALKVKKLKDGRSKMNQPSLLINRNMMAYKGLLFNHANLIGKYESKDLWKKNSVIDVYMTSSGGYWGSFYVQHRKKNKMSQMLMTDHYFYIISGNEIVRYRCAQTLTSSFIQRE